MSDYLRLPKGFHVRDSEFFDVFTAVHVALKDTSERSGYQILLLPSLGFASTFERAADTTGQKTFAFTDRNGRALTLSPDSTPGLLRWYLENASHDGPVQTSWVAPLYRYRHITNRAFHQFGLTFINLPLSPDTLTDTPLIEATNFILKLFRIHFGVCPTVQITNVGAIRRLLSKLLPDGASVEHIISELHALKDSHQRIGRVLQSCPSSSEREALIALLQGDGAAKTSEAQAIIVNVYKEVEAFATALLNCCSVEICVSDLHSSQTLSGLGVRFRGPNGESLGDGGRYDVYGKRFSERIHSVVSVCSGIEALAREIGVPSKGKAVNLSLIVFPECGVYGLSLAEDLRERGIRVHVVHLVGSVKKSVARAAQRSDFFALLGPDDTLTGRLTVVRSLDGERIQVSIRNLADWMERMYIGLDTGS